MFLGIASGPSWASSLMIALLVRIYLWGEIRSSDEDAWRSLSETNRARVSAP